ncbi:hypothetical protein MP228_004635 [Amoeboaphelidium protococcarum]|nr:hypothetical protein MP228_004635 [Amoeboaphelidium protococcarum]
MGNTKLLVSIIKQLADNDATLRDKAFQELQKSLYHLIDEQDDDQFRLNVLKIQKGLFYYMWMCDKPANQERAANGIASLIFLMGDDDAVVCMELLRGFWIIMAREWAKIDKYRLDKFYLLVKRVMVATFEFLISVEHDTALFEACIELYQDVLMSSVLNVDDPPRCPRGLLYHLTGYYLACYQEAVESSQQKFVMENQSEFYHYLLVFPQYVNEVILTALEQSKKLGNVQFDKIWLEKLQNEIFSQCSSTEQFSFDQEKYFAQVNKIANALASYSNEGVQKFQSVMRKILPSYDQVTQTMCSQKTVSQQRKTIVKSYAGAWLVRDLSQCCSVDSLKQLDNNFQTSKSVQFSPMKKIQTFQKQEIISKNSGMDKVASVESDKKSLSPIKSLIKKRDNVVSVDPPIEMEIVHNDNDFEELYEEGDSDAEYFDDGMDGYGDGEEMDEDEEVFMFSHDNHGEDYSEDGESMDED